MRVPRHLWNSNRIPQVMRTPLNSAEVKPQVSNKCICSPVKSIPCSAASAYYAFCLFHKEENNSSFPILLKYHNTRHLIWFNFNYTNFTSNQLLCKAYSDLKAAAGLLISIREN